MTSPPITAHRLARLIAWARLWLSWFAAILVQLIALDPKQADAATKAAARGVGNLIILQAVLRFAGPGIGRQYGPSTDPSGGMRSLKGARLRRRLAARDPIARFFAILSLMRDFDAEVARFCRRIARGLTRWRSHRYAWADAADAPSPTFPACIDNSS